MAVVCSQPVAVILGTLQMLAGRHTDIILSSMFEGSVDSFLNVLLYM